MSSYAPYSLPKNSLAVASINNALCTSVYPWSMQIGAKSVLLKPVFSALEAEYASVLEVKLGQDTFYLALQKDAWCFFHKAFENIGNIQVIPLPEQLEQAFLENMARPVFESLGNLLGVNADIINSHVQLNAQDNRFSYDALQVRHERVCFALTVQGEENAIFKDKEFFADIWIAKNYNAISLIPRLLQILPRLNKQDSMLDLDDTTLHISFETGYVRLSPTTLRELECGDLLLPDRLHTQYEVDGKTLLRLVLHKNTANIGLSYIFTTGSIEGNQVKVLENWRMNEQELQHMENDEELSEHEETDAENASLQDVLDNLELVVSFELERRNMSLQDVKTVTEGYTFALECNKDAPVSLCVNGKKIGVGRLVDMDGLLGVEVIKLG